MRPLILILVLANLGFAAWALLVDEPTEAPAARDISHLSKLTIAREPSRDGSSGSGPVAPSAPGAVSEAAAGSHCVTVGPFSDLVFSAAAAALLQSRGFTPTQRDEAGQDLTSYWVHLDGIASDAAANRVVLMLRAIGLTDVRTMPTSTPEEARRVSVGLFTEKQGADRRARAVKAGLGLTPVITEQHQAEATYWVDVILKSPTQSLSTEGLMPPAAKGTHLEIRDCPAPASSAPSK